MPNLPGEEAGEDRQVFDMLHPARMKQREFKNFRLPKVEDFCEIFSSPTI
jgi:hypothetical protein